MEYDWLLGGPKRLLTAERASIGLGRIGVPELTGRLDTAEGSELLGRGA